jgi:hypothetical protein
MTFLKEDIEKRISGLQLELEDLKEKLEKESDLKERARLQGKINQIEQKIRLFENGYKPMPGFLLDGLKNNIREIEEEIEQEEGIEKRQQLQRQRNSYIEIAAERQRAIESKDEYEDACLQIESDERMLERIGSGYLDEVDVEILINSDLAPFIDKYFQGQLEVAFSQMITVDRTQLAYSHISADELKAKAEEEWNSFRENTENKILELEAEKKEIENNPGKKLEIRERQRRRLKAINHSIPFLEEQLKTGEDDWKHRYRTKIERKQPGSVMGNVHDDTILKVKQLFETAKAYKLEQIHSYLEERFEKLETLVEELESKGSSQSEFIETAREELEKAKDLYLNPDITDPEELRNIAKSLNESEIVIKAEHEEIGDKEERVANPEEKAIIIERINENYGVLQTSLNDLKELPMEALIERIAVQLVKEHGKSDAIDSIIRKRAKKLHELKTQDGKLGERIQELEAEMAELETMSAEELIRLEGSLSQLGKKLELIQEPESVLEHVEEPSYQQAVIAHETLRGLDKCITNEDIQEILEENLGEEHLSLVSHSKFETEFRQFTEGGHMVMQEDGDEWKVILDESAFINTSPEELKKELSHELLHVVFEKGDGIREQVQERFLKDYGEEWPDIRQAFLDMAEETHKQPPHGNHWEDDDILSELYAMQNEMGQSISNGDTATDRLNNLLTGAGLGEAIEGINEKAKSFENDKVTRGYQAGVEKGEEGGQPTRNLGMKTVSQERAVYEKYKGDIEGLQTRITELKKSGYLQYTKGAMKLLNIMEDYLRDTGSLNHDLAEDPGNLVLISSIEQRNGKVADELNNIETEVGKAARNAPNNEMGFLRKMWLNTTFMSAVDFGQVAIDAWEFLERRHNRRKADHAATIGMALFKGTDIGREAYARQQKAEADEVQEWKSRYENLDAWQLLDELKNLAHSIDPSKDQLKAVLRILAEKGRLNWLDANLWICLNRLQSSVELKPKDRVLLHNPVLLRQKLHKAMGEIWDYDEYSSLLRQNESAYESEKSKYESEHDRSQDTLTAKLDDMLERHRNGENVDPMEYESIIEYCIKNGKSYAENVMFHLIMGMALGILAPDRGLALGKHLNAWPTIDWFTSLQPPYTKEDFENLCKREFSASYEEHSLSGASGGRDFKNWFWRVPQNEQRVIERVQKSVNERGWDHDWARSIACLGSATTAKQFLSGRSGQIETKTTAIGNMYVGYIQWLEENAKNPEFATKEKFAKIAASIAMSEGILNGTAYNRKDSDISARQDEAMNTASPRESGVGRHAGKSLRFHRDISSTYLYMIDQEFFGFLLDPTNREARDESKKKKLGEWAAQHLAKHYPELAAEMKEVNTIDQIYDRMDLIINVMFENMSNDRFRWMLSQLAPKD